MLSGLLDLSVWGVVGYTLLVTHITIAAVTIFLHRHQAHRSVELHPVVSHFFRFWLWLTTGMVTKEWAAIHRKHHAKCETEDDPHSPQVRGIRKVLLEGSELYRAEAKNAETLEKYGFGTPNDWAERNVYTRFSKSGIAAMMFINLLLLGPIGITVWAVQMLWIPIFAAGVVNGIGHYWGYRNYETTDAATNISPWGILIGGEELHNNHHAFPSSAKLSSKPWEFDIGWFYIRAMEIAGLAQVKKVAPMPVVVPGKEMVDVETVKAVIATRFHVLSSYYRDVIVPVLREEQSRAQAQQDGTWNGLLKMARKLLVRDEARLDSSMKDRLGAILQRSHTLKTVYEYRVQLQGIWQRSSSSGHDVVASLQEWCKQAEESGIHGLREFAARLRGYSLAPAAA